MNSDPPQLEEKRNMLGLVWNGFKEFLYLFAIGFIVAWALVALLQFDYVENIDRYISDKLMAYASEHEPIREPHFLFINVGETSCRKWAAGFSSSCTLGV